MDPLALASLTSHIPVSAPPGATETGGLVINVFWILVVAANFLIFLVAAWYLGLRNLPANLGARRARIEQSLRDADAARQERENAATERLAVLTDARREAEQILVRAQRVADENRERDIADTRAQLEQMRERAAADIVSEKDRAHRRGARPGCRACLGRRWARRWRDDERRSRAPPCRGVPRPGWHGRRRRLVSKGGPSATKAN